MYTTKLKKLHIWMEAQSARYEDVLEQVQTWKPAGAIFPHGTGP